MNAFVGKQLANIRKLLDRWMEKREKEAVFPETVEIIADIPYLDPGRDCHKLDIYRPKQKEGKLPMIVNLHGGGLLLCTRKVNRIFCGELAKRGFLVFCMDYPLVPEADIPEILGDVARGMDFVAEQAEQWGGDPEQIYLVGDSAGAFLSVYELAAQRNAQVAQSLKLVPSIVNVKAAAYISGMYYTAKLDSVGAFLREDFYGKNWKGNPFRPFADPAVPEIAGAMPPTLLVTAKLDNLRSYTLAFRKGLENAGISHRMLDLPAKAELSHDFVIVKPELPEAQQVIQEICAFLKQY